MKRGQKIIPTLNFLDTIEPDENTTEGRRELTERTLCKMIGELSKGGDALGSELAATTAQTLARSMCDFQREIDREDERAAVIRRITKDNDDLAYLAERERKRSKKAAEHGRRGARQVKRTTDAPRKALLDEVKKLVKERDEQGKLRDHEGEPLTNNALYRIAQQRHLGANGKPILSIEAIKKALLRSRAENRGKHNRTGKTRGKYKPRA